MKTLLLYSVLLSISHVLLLLLPQYASSASNSTLELRMGLRLSPNASFFYDSSSNTFRPMSNATMFTVAIPAFGNHAYAWFLPIVSSPSFNSSNSSQSPGFSLGFFFNASATAGADASNAIYLAVCGGLSGNFSNPTSSEPMPDLYGANDSEIEMIMPYVKDGYVVPVWIANPFTSLRSYNASLVVGQGSKKLQLEDYDGTVLWKVPNVGALMEMEDTGELTIYDTIHKTKVVWQSPPRDTLFRVEKLGVGMQLTSKDSSYMARFEKGGLVLYLNTLEFMGEQPAPYWVIPALLNDSTDNPFNVNNKVMSSPCSGPNNINDTAYAFLAYDQGFYLNIEAGPACSHDGPLQLVWNSSSLAFNGDPLMSFVKLENEGSLSSYAVPLNNSVSTSQTPVQLTMSNMFRRNFSSVDYILQASLWESCKLPYACGPLGVCTPKQPNPCSCPTNPSSSQVTFKTIVDHDFSKGCTRKTKLPNCTKHEHVDTTDFLQLDHTASIFLFSGWLFNSILAAKVESCMTRCSSNCSCNGFFYQANNSACFFITDEMSLLNLTQDYHGSWAVDILKRNYVTYLKKAKADQIGELSPSFPAGLAGKTTGLNKTTLIAIGAIASSFTGCVGLAFALSLYSKARKRRLLIKQARQDEEELREVLPLLPSRFSYQELHEATRGFSKLLGAGGCGSVYAGVLQDGRKVAVKTLELSRKYQSKQFLAEVATIGQTSHHNIVRLVGFCWEVSRRLLVYEYLERGSLDHWLFHKFASDASCDDDDEGAPLLDWQTRFNVVLGIVQGLSYLHEECPEPILHFDIKPQNILLDGDFVAKLADFGMSRLMKRDVSEVVTALRGTPGYIAPEWLLHGAVSKKGDIYSMGMVMLEIVGGRKNVDLDLLNNLNVGLAEGGRHQPWHFPSWAARKCEVGRETELLDRRLHGAFNEAEAQRLIYTAFWCIQEDPAMRPYAPTALQWLKGSSPVERPPFSSAFHSSFGSTPSFSHPFSALGITSSRGGAL